MLLEIAVNNHKWNVHKNPGSLEGAWITSEELGQKLGYENPRKSTLKIYERFSQNFTDKIDTGVVILTTPAGHQKTRVFSERGALKIIRHSETEIADKIMDEVSDLNSFSSTVNLTVFDVALMFTGFPSDINLMSELVCLCSLGLLEIIVYFALCFFDGLLIFSGLDGFLRLLGTQKNTKKL